MPYMASTASLFYPIFEQLLKTTISKFVQNAYNKEIVIGRMDGRTMNTDGDLLQYSSQ